MNKKCYYYLTILVACMTLCFTACGGDDPIEDPTPTPTPTPEPEPEPEPEDPYANLSPAIGWPATYDGVMLQAFSWDSYDETQWVVLQSQADDLAGTFDLVWLPQSGNCGGGKSMGYDDLYWFNNYESSFGTEQQLRSLISTFKQKGIKTIADVVINHRRNISNWVDFPKESYKGVTYEMKSTDIVKDDDGGDALRWASKNGYQLSANNDTGEGWDGMRDLDHKSENVQKCVIAYLDFLMNDLGYAGFRYDMVKGYSAKYTGIYNASSKPEFSVGECWDGSNTIKNWMVGTKIKDQIQSAAFDFQFKYVVRNATKGNNWTNLEFQNDGNWPLVSNKYEEGKYRRYAVTFVENHDTQLRADGSSNGPLERDTLAANAYMLAMPGTPCVFLPHWLDYAAQIKTMVAARKQAGINSESSYKVYLSNARYYAITTQTGNEDRMLTALGNVSKIDESVDAKQWCKVTQGYHYAYYFPTSMDIAYADMPSGTYEGTQQVMLSAVTSADGAQVVYTTDGTEPTAASNPVASGYVLTFAPSTVTLKVGLLVGGQVSKVITRNYTIKESEKDKPVEIPEFCEVKKGEVCAFFEAPSIWTDKVMCWAWSDNPSENFTSATGAWPGTSCTLLGTAPDGNKVWKWTWDGTRQNNTSLTKPAKIIFSNGTEGKPQTSDMDFQNGGYYTIYGLKGTVVSE